MVGKSKQSKLVTLGRKEAAERLGISLITLDRELAKNRIPHFRVGRRVLFTMEHLQLYVQMNECRADFDPNPKAAVHRN